MLFDVKKWFIFLYVKAGFTPKFGYLIVYKQEHYTYLCKGLYIKRFFSLTFKMLYEIAFLNNKNQLVKLHLFNKKYLNKYKSLPGYSVNKKVVWKR